jgi:2-dehydro-3-deoxygalactonokinase
MRNGIAWVSENDRNRTSQRGRRAAHPSRPSWPFDATPLPLTITRMDLEGKKKARNMHEPRIEPVVDQPWRVAIALDGGTTNTRARLVHDGRIIATARREIGVRDTVLSDQSPRERLAGAVREVIAEASAGPGLLNGNDGNPAVVELIVASGMLTSEVGLVMVPHVEAPASLDDLAGAVVARTLPEIGADPIHFVPGLRTPAHDGPDGWMYADVMRGEECETFGALTELVRRGTVSRRDLGLAFVWPGSHTKLVEVDAQGRITRSHTSLAGEFLQAIARHTLIAASLPSKLPDQLDPDSAEAGARAVLNQGLERAAFLVRVAALRETMTREERAAFWIGAVVADDVGHLVKHPILAMGRPVFVGGREPLRTWYTRWLGRFHDGPVDALDDNLAEDSSALGALAVVSSHRGGSRSDE